MSEAKRNATDISLCRKLSNLPNLEMTDLFEITETHAEETWVKVKIYPSGKKKSKAITYELWRMKNKRNGRTTASTSKARECTCGSA